MSSTVVRKTPEVSSLAKTFSTTSLAGTGGNAAFDLIGLTQLRSDERYVGIDGSGFSVAVIDTGLDRDHPLLASNYQAGFDFINNRNDPIDLSGHGTHVAGIVGSSDDLIGVAPDVGLIGLQVFQSDITGTFTAPNFAIEDALEWVLDNHDEYNITAVNMSLGSGHYASDAGLASLYSDDVERLEAAGITVVAAAGNSYKDNEYGNLASPAVFSTLAVSSVWQDGSNSNLEWSSGAIDFTTGADRIVSHSQRLPASNSLFAPGALITSTIPGSTANDIGQKGGTSMAAPMVAGAIALMQEAALQFGGRQLTPDEVVDILISTADSIFDGDDENDNVFNTNTRYPRLNVFNAITEIERRFGLTAPPSGDPNGTINGAFIGPSLNGSEIQFVNGTIGIDGGSTPVGDTDVDIIRFQVLSPGEVQLEATSNPNTPDDFDSYLRLFDQVGNQLASDDDGGVGTFSQLTTFLAPGTYYVGISGYNNDNYNPNVAGSGIGGATGSYKLNFSLNNADPNGLLSGAVDVNLGNSLDPLRFSGSIGNDFGAAVGVADVDLFRLVVPDNGTLLIDIDTPYSSGYVDSYLRLFDENGGELLFPNGSLFASDDALSFDRVGNPTEFTDDRFPGLVFEDPVDRDFFNGHTTDSFLGAIVERGETYYIGVSDYFNQTYDPSSLENRPAIGEGGGYDLIVTFENNDLNGSINQAIDVTVPLLEQSGSIGTDGDPLNGQLREVGNKDVDFLRVNVANNGILEIDIDSFDISTELADPVDATLSIFNGEGNLLAFRDDSDGFDPRLQLEISADTDYFVAITGFGNENFDPFALGSGTGGDSGDYVVSAKLLSTASRTILSDNQITGGLNTIAVGETRAGSIGEDGDFVLGATDVDLYRFIPETTGQLEIFTSTNEEFSADTVLRLFDRDGNQIAFNDDAGGGSLSSYLQAEVSAGATYYIGVNGYSPDALNYNPLTGAGAAPGSQGLYTLSIGALSNLDPSDSPPDFEPDDYLASYPDLIAAFGYDLEAATQHYETLGQGEGRVIDNFPEVEYLASYGDLQTIFGSDLTAATRHYIEHGYREGRDPLRGFDGATYIASYDDLIAAFGYNPDGGREHYRQWGYQEGRVTSFAGDKYLASHGDLIEAFGYNPAAATQHYITSGQSEGRSRDRFDGQAYLDRYPDLQAALGSDLGAAARHYIEFGYGEGRSWGNT